MNALALALLLAASDVPLVDVARGTLEAKNGAIHQVSGGVWIEDRLLIERATQLQQLAEENKRLKEQPPQSTQQPARGGVAVLVAFAVGLTVGALVVFVAR